MLRNLKLRHPLAVLDLETTGVDTKTTGSSKSAF